MQGAAQSASLLPRTSNPHLLVPLPAPSPYPPPPKALGPLLRDSDPDNIALMNIAEQTGSAPTGSIAIADTPSMTEDEAAELLTVHSEDASALLAAAKKTGFFSFPVSAGRAQGFAYYSVPPQFFQRGVHMVEQLITLFALVVIRSFES